MTQKLVLVLTAGPYVYAEHVAIYSDVCKRMLRLSELCTPYNAKGLEVELIAYIDMLGSAQALYKNTHVDKDPLIPVLFEDAHKSCLTWLLAFPSNHAITNQSVQALKKAFDLKNGKARASQEAAIYRQKEFASGNDLSHRLPIVSAVTAWCITLPKPQITKQRSSSVSFEIPYLPSTPELKRRLSSATGKLE